MSREQVIAPCPFCGAEPMIGPWKEAIDQSDTAPTAIECGSDLHDCPVNPSVARWTREEAIAAWNRRPAAEQAVAQGDGPEPFDWSMVRNALACGCHLHTHQVCDKCQSWGAIRQLQARNAEQAAELVRLRAEVAILENNLEAQESCTASVGADFDRLNESRADLLAGIEALEKEWDAEGDSGPWFVCAAKLKAIREAAGLPAAPAG